MVNADFNEPQPGSDRDDVLEYIRKNLVALCKMALAGLSNVPTDAIQLDTANRRFQRYDGSSWSTLPVEPAGIIKMYGGSAAPEGHLLCDGSAVSRTTYAALFSAISTNFGAGDGSTTFNLPDLRGRFALGKAVSGTGSATGSTGGSLDHTHTGPSHTHTVTSHNHVMVHVHTVASHCHSLSGHTHGLNNHTHTVPAHYHGVGTLAVASGGSHTHNMRYKDTGMAGTDRKVIPASSGTDGYVATEAGGDHAHTLSGYAGNVGGVSGDESSGMISNIPSVANTLGPSTVNSGYTTAYTGDASTPSTGLTTGTTAAGGTDATGSNNPPYQVVNYIITI